ncbi:MAG: hypothetical protein ACYSWO_14360 [Planctomycetota bacterium]|jgi:hypothetical protein
MGQGKANLVRNALNDRIGDQVKEFADKFMAALGGRLQSVAAAASSPKDDLKPGRSGIEAVL